MFLALGPAGNPLFIPSGVSFQCHRRFNLTKMGCLCVTLRLNLLPDTTFFNLRQSLFFFTGLSLFKLAGIACLKQRGEKSSRTSSDTVQSNSSLFKPRWSLSPDFHFQRCRNYIYKREYTLSKESLENTLKIKISKINNFVLNSTALITL